MTKFSLKNKVAIVTGGGSGIGKAISLTFAKQGAKVHILDFNVEAAEETVSEVKNFGELAKAHKCDVANQQNVIDTLKAKLQKVQDAELTALLDEKKVPTKQRQEYINIANKMGMDTVKVVLSNLTSPVVPLTGSKTTTDRTYAEWEKEDPQGLLEMMCNDPEQFNALLETY